MDYGSVSCFEEELRADQALLARVKDCGPYPEKVLAVAKTRGYGFSVEELMAYVEERKGRLDDDRLDKVAGGVDTFTNVDDSATMITR